jgi:hypothetical protein
LGLLSARASAWPTPAASLASRNRPIYRWKKEYGGLRVDQAKRLKGLEQENARLKRLVADLSLDNSILKEVAAGNF